VVSGRLAQSRTPRQVASHRLSRSERATAPSACSVATPSELGIQDERREQFVAAGEERHRQTTPCQIAGHGRSERFAPSIEVTPRGRLDLFDHLGAYAARSVCVGMPASMRPEHDVI
jgi:hypothetical protein